MECQTRAEGKFTSALEIGVPGARSLSRMIRESRPYFLCGGHMGRGPLLLQPANGAVELRISAIWKIRTCGYLSK